MKRILAVALCLLMLLGVFASCGGNKPPQPGPEGTTDGADTSVSTDPPVTTEYPVMPENAKYDGYEFLALVAKYRSNTMNDFSVENENFAVVNEAIFKRNEKIAELFDCSIDFVEVVGSAFGNGPSFQKVRADYTASQSPYDACAVSTYDAPQLAVNQYIIDLEEIPFIDLTRNWWDQQANNDLCVAGRMYYSTGDISISDNLATHCILFSKPLAEENNITDLYQLVSEKKWTYDRFAEYARGVSKDLNGDDLIDVNDRYGLLCWNDGFQASIAGIKGRICTVNEDGLIENTMYSERNAAMADKICELFFNSSVSFNHANNKIDTVSASRADYFSEGHGLFYMTMFSAVPALRDLTDFGILPYPLYDEEQESYGSYMGSTYSVMYCVENFVEDLERTGAFMEMLAYQSKIYVTPAYYEQTLKGRDVKDEESIVSLDIIFANRTFDVGILYKIGSYTGDLTNMIKEGTNKFTRIYETKRRAAQVMIDQINKNFQK